jgi:hypothetical protein
MTLEGDAKQNSSMIGHLIDDVKMLSLLSFFFVFVFFFFFDMSTQERGWGIRISDFHFIKRCSIQLNYLLGTMLRCC